MTQKSVVLTICQGVRRKPLLEAVIVEGQPGHLVLSEGVKDEKGTIEKTIGPLRRIVEALERMLDENA